MLLHGKPKMPGNYRLQALNICYDSARNMFRAGLLFIVISFLVSCGKPAIQAPSKPIGDRVLIKTSLGLPELAVPAENPPTAETIALGRRLFYDPKLSSDDTVSCASCHDPKFGFADRRRVSVGVGGKTGNRNSPPVLNAAYNTVQFWDGRAPTLEEQAAGPIANPVEMKHTLEDCVRKLNGDTKYPEQFNQAFGPGGVTLPRLKNAIASFERTLISGGSAFDRYQFGGEKKALSQSAIRCGQPLTAARDDRSPMLNACLPCARRWASTGTLASRNFRSSSIVTSSQPYSSSFAQRRNAGGASAGIFAGGLPPG